MIVIIEFVTTIMPFIVTVASPFAFRSLLHWIFRRADAFFYTSSLLSLSFSFYFYFYSAVLFLKNFTMLPHSYSSTVSLISYTFDLNYKYKLDVRVLYIYKKGLSHVATIYNVSHFCCCCSLLELLMSLVQFSCLATFYSALTCILPFMCFQCFRVVPLTFHHVCHSVGHTIN